jgi:hypothetical protein
MERLAKLAAEAKESAAASQLRPLPGLDPNVVNELNRQAAEADAAQKEMADTLAEVETQTATGTATGTIFPPAPSSAIPFGYTAPEPPGEPSVLGPRTIPTLRLPLPEMVETGTPSTLGSKIPPSEDEPRVAFPPPSSAVSVPPSSATPPIPASLTDARRTSQTRRNKPSPPAVPKPSSRKSSETRVINVQPAPAPAPEPAPAPAPSPVVSQSRLLSRGGPTNMPGKWARVSTPYLAMGTQKKGGLRKKKLRTRRGVKQNVRRSRGGKNRANRTSSHTRRRA